MREVALADSGGTAAHRNRSPHPDRPNSVAGGESRACQASQHVGARREWSYLSGVHCHCQHAVIANSAGELDEPRSSPSCSRIAAAAASLTRCRRSRARVNSIIADPSGGPHPAVLRTAAIVVSATPRFRAMPVCAPQTYAASNSRATVIAASDMHPHVQRTLKPHVGPQVRHPLCQFRAMQED